MPLSLLPFGQESGPLCIPVLLPMLCWLYVLLKKNILSYVCSPLTFAISTSNSMPCVLYVLPFLTFACLCPAPARLVLTVAWGCISV